MNPYLFELANIREQDSWVHQGEPEAATEKAKDLVRMAVSRARLLEPLHDFSYQVVQRALVIGGGLAGLTATMSIADQGFEAVLVERASELGGNARTLHYTEDGANPAGYVQELIRKVEEYPLITDPSERAGRRYYGQLRQFHYDGRRQRKQDGHRPRRYACRYRGRGIQTH